MVTCKPIPESDWPAAFAIHQEYLDSQQSVEEFSILYRKYPTLYVGCYLADVLIGICFGYPFEEKRPESRAVIVLEGIAIQYDYWNLGYGSQLLQAWEAQVRDWPGYAKIGVGSASNLETENFYLKNSFVPVQLCIKVPVARLAADYAERGYPFVEQRQINGVMNLYLATATRDKTVQARLKNEFNADEVIFILQKAI